MNETPLAVVTDYSGLVAALRERAIARKIAVSGEVNEVAGLPSGYVEKLIGPRPVRRLGIISLGPLLAVLGIKLAVIEDPEALARYGSRIGERQEKYVRSDALHYAVHFSTTKRFLKQ